MKLNEVNTPWETHKTVEYAKDGNTVVRRNRSMHVLEEPYYSGEILGDEYSKGASIYVYYSELDIALYLGGSHESNDTEYILEQCRKMKMETPKQLIETLDQKAEQNQFIKDIWITVAALLVPEKIPSYRAAKAAYLEERERKDRERQAELQAEQKKRLEALQAQTQNQRQAAVDVLRNGGTLRNQEITIYRTIHDSSVYSIINYLAREYGVNIPIKTQGWINNSLVEITVGNGKMTGGRMSGKNQSTVIYKYMNQLIEAVRKAEAA